MPVSWQTRFFSLSATWTFLRIVFKRTRCPGTLVSRAAASASASRRSCGMSFSAQTYRWAAASSTAPYRSVSIVGAQRSLCAPLSARRRPAGAAPEDAALQQRVAHHPVPAVRATGDLATGEETFERRLALGVDHEAAVLVVEDRVGQDRLRQGVDSGRPVAPQHVRQRHLRVGLRNAGGVEQHRRAPVGRLHAVALFDLVEDRLRDRVTRPERVGELLVLPVQQHGAVRAGGLGDRVALHVGGPGSAVRVILERVEVPRLRTEAERDLRDLTGGAGMVGGELAALLGLPVTAAAGGEHDRRSVHLVVADACRPAVLRPLQTGERALGQGRPGAGLPRLAQPGGDRVPGAVADLEEALARRPAALGDPVAAVFPRELDAQLLEPVDRRLRVAGQHLDQAHVGRLVARLPDVLGMELGGVVLAERCLDPALRLGRVARLERPLRRDRDTGAGPLGGHRGGEPGGPAADHEHVEREPLGHGQNATKDANATN